MEAYILYQRLVNCREVRPCLYISQVSDLQKQRSSLPRPRRSCFWSKYSQLILDRKSATRGGSHKDNVDECLRFQTACYKNGFFQILESLLPQVQTMDFFPTAEKGEEVHFCFHIYGSYVIYLFTLLFLVMFVNEIFIICY